MSNTSIVRFTFGKSTFEILTKPGSISQYRKGQLGLSNCLVGDEVFKNASSGDRPSDAELIEAFGTADQFKVIEKIANEGEVQLTASERRELVAAKRRAMIAYIHKNFTDPKSGLPIPVTRIENAFDQIHLRIDPFQPAERQVQEQVMKPIVSLIPMKKSEIEGTVFIPHSVLGKCLSIIHQYANVNKENYTGEGCELHVTLAPGDYDQFNRELSAASKGEVSINIGGTSEPAADTTQSKKKGKGRKK
ncbi:hypothetical protein GEMRC1_004055 [Eukaryota sp. GEM-RC1]